MLKISKHISYREAVHSATAKRRGLDNTPNDNQLDNMYKVANLDSSSIEEKVLDLLNSNIILQKQK